MPEYLSPGVYIEETSFRSKSIEGVSTSVCGMVGPVRFGPLGPGEPELLTSFADFQRLYGDLAPLTFAVDGAETAKENYVALGAKAFFDNGGTKLYVKRVACLTEGSGFAAGQVAAGVAFKARFAGSGGNGEVLVEESLSENVLVGLDGGPLQLAGVGQGALVSIFSGADEPTPARAVAGTGPFDLTPGDDGEARSLTVDVVGTGSVTVRFGRRQPARIEATPDLSGGLPADVTVTVTVDDRPTEVTLRAGSLDGFQLANALNVVHGISVQFLDGTLVLEHDTAGEGHTLHVQGGPFGDAVEEKEGSGNVEVLAQVTVQEVLAALEAASSEAALALGLDDSGHLSIATTAVGPTAVLRITSSKLDAFSFTDPAPAAGAVTAKGSGAGDFWLVGAGGLKNREGQTKSLQEAVEEVGEDPQAKLVSYFVTVELATGAVHSYGPVTFDSEGARYIGAAMPRNPAKRFDELTQPVWFEDAGTTKKTVFEMRDALLAKRWRVPLTGGADGADPVAADYERGLEALRLLEEISIVCAPGYSRRLGREGSSVVTSINQALTTHVAKARYCVALLDPEPDSTVGTVRNYKADIDDSRLALYYPWVITANPNASPWKKDVPSEVSQPPSGFIAGIYARNDVERGVHKAPANEVVRGALRFEVALNKAHQDVLNPEGINALRRFEGRGLRVWGARTCSSDPEWKYVNVRRYMLYLERSIELSTQWAVFEPNGPRLWSNVTTAISDFLYSEWRKGALLGLDPKQAYFVRCDLTTMDQNDLDNGRMVCLIGVAPVRPAEFVIFRIGQKTATSAE